MVGGVAHRTCWSRPAISSSKCRRRNFSSRWARALVVAIPTAWERSVELRDTSAWRTTFRFLDRSSASGGSERVSWSIHRREAFRWWKAVWRSLAAEQSNGNQTPSVYLGTNTTSSNRAHADPCSVGGGLAFAGSAIAMRFQRGEQTRAPMGRRLRAALRAGPQDEAQTRQGDRERPMAQ